jgi:hypothetical protein
MITSCVCVSLSCVCWWYVGVSQLVLIVEKFTLNSAIWRDQKTHHFKTKNSFFRASTFSLQFLLVEFMPKCLMQLCGAVQM